MTCYTKNLMFIIGALLTLQHPALKAEQTNETNILDKLIAQAKQKVTPKEVMEHRFKQFKTKTESKMISSREASPQEQHLAKTTRPLTRKRTKLYPKALRKKPRSS